MQQVTFTSKLSISSLWSIQENVFERSWLWFKFWTLVKSSDSQNRLAHKSDSMTLNGHVSCENSVNKSQSIIFLILWLIGHLFTVWFVVLQKPQYIYIFNVDDFVHRISYFLLICRYLIFVRFCRWVLGRFGKIDYVIIFYSRK